MRLTEIGGLTTYLATELAKLWYCDGTLPFCTFATKPFGYFRKHRSTRRFIASVSSVLRNVSIKWQWHLMDTFRKTLETDAMKRLVDLCFRKYPGGLVANVQKGKVPSQYQSVASYVAKYVVSPPIAVRRIDRYDGERVTDHYRSHRTERTEHATVDVNTFIGRMVQLCG